MHPHDGTVLLPGDDKPLGMDTAEPGPFGAAALGLTVQIKDWKVVFMQVNYQFDRAHGQDAGLRRDRVVFFPVPQKFNALGKR